MAKLKLTVVLLLSVLVFVFVVQNWEVVSLRFLFWSFEVPRLLLVVMLLLFGFILGVVYGTLNRSDDGSLE